MQRHFFLWVALAALLCANVVELSKNKAKNEGRSFSSKNYTGEYDLTARQTVGLCEAVKRRDLGEPLDEPSPEPDKSTYLRDGKCWKFEWKPCDNFVRGKNNPDDRIGTEGVLAKRRKPCGHFAMVKAPKDQC